MPPDPAPRPQPARRQEPAVTPRRRPAVPRRRPPDPADEGPLVPGTGLPILRAQRDAGNAAVVGALQGARRESLPIRVARLPVQRNVPPPPPSGIPDNYDEMSDTQKTAVIRDLVARDPGSVYRAWKRLGSPLAVARANPDLFTASMKIDDDIVDLDAFEGLRDQFERDVLATARGYLTSNKGFIQQERERTGGVRAADTVGGAVQARVDILSGKGGSAETDEEVQKVQKAAEQMEGIKTRKATCLSTPVGYNTEWKRGMGNEPVEVHTTAVFSPGKPPEDTRPGMPSYEVVMEQWTKLIAAEAQLVRKHPSAAFFIGEGGDPSKLKNEQDIRVARAEIANALDDLEAKIDKAIPLIGDDIDFNELVPIHGQLMGGTPGPSGTVWSKPVEKAVAKETVSDADMWDLLATLGVGTLGAALFLFAELASGGLATFLFAAGAATSAGQMAKSWKDYTDLAAANKASINPEEVLISGEQVDEALLAAVLDTVFVVVDGFQAYKGATKIAAGGAAALEGGKAGAKAGAELALKNLRGASNPAAALAQAVAEVGPEQARKISGLGFDDLAKIAGENTDLGKQFAMLAEKGAGAMSDATRALVTQLPDVGKLSAEEGEKVLAAAVSQYGYKGVLEKVGGWGALKASPVMKSGAGTAAALEGWRSSIVKELAQFMEEESGRMSKAVRSGTEKAASDLDVQVIGGTASELQAKAEGWLAGRLGADSKAAKKLLDAEIFIDPTRAHLIDTMKELGEDVRGQINGRMASYEQQMIYGARLKEAQKQGKEAVDKILAEARERGITPFEGFEPMSPSLQKQTAAQIDAWMVELKDPANASRRAELVEKISKAQAHINASHPDAYVGGGVAIWVSGRDTDVAKIAEALNLDPADLAKATTAQRISAALSEGKWLDAAVQQLKSGAGGDIDELTKAVRNIGKHGARAAEVLRVPGKTNVGRLEYLMEVLQSYKAVEPKQLEALVTSGDLALMRGEITRILDGLASETTAAVSALQKDAGALGVSISEMADFQHWLKWSGRYRQLTTAAGGAAAAQIRALETALEGVQQQSVQPPRESRDYPLPPNQSVMPPG